MSLQLKGSTRNRNIKLSATAGALIIGAGYIIFKTFPHLKTTLYNTLTGARVESELDADDNEPIELNDSNFGSSHDEFISDESLVNVEEWSDDNLKSWLSEVRTRMTMSSVRRILTHTERNYASIQCFSS